MSTFKGIVAEFPQIRIDYFRQQPGHKAPLACFLSHIHSDHLTGLESLRAPFVYCSATTREILLRLEKYHYRVNYARGILESQYVTYDRSMRKLAKPLPLDTPTTIELAPGNKIRVTLIDANHCVGAVMFLIEGDGKAILYSGDIRAETWWVNSLVQNPVLLPYTLGSRRLNCMYLDTTFATKSNAYRDFPSKAEGIKELLEKVEAYPKDTIFYFHSWTFGYENVWIALSNFLQSRIHLDDYRAQIYASLSTLDKKSLREGGIDVPSENKYLRDSGLEIREAPALCGFRNGNHIQPGCLTSHPDVRIHSCERGMGCPVMDEETKARVVHIVPIVNRVDNTEILEIGAGGGKGDLDQKEELETGDAVDVMKLMELCTKTMKEPDLLVKVLKLVRKAFDSGNGTMNLNMDLQGETQDGYPDLSLPKLVSALSSHVSKAQTSVEQANKSIRFPYSRHSSYYELCELVDAFKPRDIFPCTVNEANWDPALGMNYLFGAYCSDGIFRHDAEMMKIYAARLEQESNANRDYESQQETQNSDDTEPPSPVAMKRPRMDEEQPTVSKRQKLDSTTLISPPKRKRPSPSSTVDIEIPEIAPIIIQASFAVKPSPKPEKTQSPLIEEKTLPSKKATTPAEEQPSKQYHPMPSPPKHSSPILPPISATLVPKYISKHIKPPTPSQVQKPPPPVATPTLKPNKPSDPPPVIPKTPIQPPLPPSKTTLPRSSPLIPFSLRGVATMEDLRRRQRNRKLAYDAAIGSGLTWADFGGLVCTRRKEDGWEFEEEL